MVELSYFKLDPEELSKRKARNLLKDKLLWFIKIIYSKN